MSTSHPHVAERATVYPVIERMMAEAPQWTTMGEIAEVVGGGTPRTSDPTNFEGGDIPWITPADLSGYTEKYISRGSRFITQKGLASSAARLLPAGAVLFTSRAPIGYVAIARNAIATNQGFKSFVLMDGILPEYVYWWLKGSKHRAESLASGTTFLELSGANAKKLPIPIVPLERQQEIVAEIEKQFSRLDEAVANLKRAKANLKRYEAAVLNVAVQGRLVPTEGNLARSAGRDYEPAALLLARMLRKRREQWSGRGVYQEPGAPESSHLPVLPDGWAWASIEQVASGERYALSIGPFGSSLKVSDYESSGVPLVFVRNIRARKFRDEDAVFVSPEKAAELRAHWVAGGDLLITKMGAPPGDVCVYPQHRPTAVITADCIKLRPSAILASATYLEVAIAADVVQKQIAGITQGVAQQKISLGRFSTIAVPLPPLAEQHRVVAEVDRRLSLVREVEANVAANLKRAQSLRQAVLQAAFACKLPA